MGDAVVRVRSHLQALARDDWTSLEERHARNVSALREELAQISRALELKTQWEKQDAVVFAPFPRCMEDVEVPKPARKKQKIAKESPKKDKEKGRTRRSMRLRSMSVERISVDTGNKKRKRARPSEELLQDPGKLKVVELRSELKKRGLRTTGVKAVLFDRLLDALEEEQHTAHMERVEENDVEKQEKVQGQEVIVIDDPEEDEIVRESIGSNKSPGRYLRSQSTSPKAVAAVEDDRKDVEQIPKLDDDVLNRRDDEEENADPPPRIEINATETASTAPYEDSDTSERQVPVLETTSGSRHGVEFDVNDKAIDLLTRDTSKLTRKSMQLGHRSELSSPWKRKSILRKASSLAPSTRGPSRKVSFAPTDKVDIIVESSQTESTQPDPSPEKSTPSDDTHSPHEEEKHFSIDAVPVADAESKSFGTPVAQNSAPSMPKDPSPALAAPKSETEAERREREFQESVAREAQRLRLAAKLSAQKRLEEAKATKAFWAKREQLKLKLRASSVGDKKISTHTPVSVSDKAAAERVSPPISESSTTSEGSSMASKDEARTQSPLTLPPPNEMETQRHASSRPTIRQHEVEEISNVSSTFEGSRYEPKAPRSTFSVVEEEHQAERSLPQLGDKPAEKSMPAAEIIPRKSPKNNTPHSDIGRLRRQEADESSFLTAIPSYNREDVTRKADSSKMLVPEPSESRNRSDSLSSTVSSIPDLSVVENALKTGASRTANGRRKPIANLVSGLHSFTTLLEKDLSQESSSGRSAPVVNALKLAEKSRLLEEKKRIEKEKRKALLKKKMEEHKKAAALKEKAEKDAQAKREQERLNDRKKREAELAKKRQQRLKEMRAGLEKKRAMLAAEKKSAVASSSTAASKSAATASHHHKHRGLASASEAPPPTTKPAQKPTSKPAPKPAPKPQSVSEPVSKPMTQSVPKPALTSPFPAKQVPKSHSPELVNYEMSDNAESSDGDSSDSDSDRHGKKKVPRWAQKDHLNKILHAQFGRDAVDPSPAIFQDFVDTCNLEAIFETTDIRKKKKFARRTSSGNWLADRPTARDRALYQRDMGYER